MKSRIILADKVTENDEYEPWASVNGNAAAVVDEVAMVSGTGIWLRARTWKTYGNVL